MYVYSISIWYIMYMDNVQLKQLLSDELPYEEDWDDGSISNSVLESADDSSTVHSNDTSPATSISTESLNKVHMY